MNLDNVHKVKWLVIFGAIVFSALTSYENLYHYEEKLDEHGHTAEEHQESVDELIQEAESDTTNIDLQLRLARMHQSSGDYKAAIKYYKRVERHSDLNADILSELGMTLWAEKPGVSAVKYFTEALKKDSLHPAALLGLGIASSTVGENEQATRYFDLVIKNHSETEAAQIAQQWKNNIKK